MPDEMQDPRMAQMAMMRDRFMQNRNQADQARAQFNGGLSLPEQLPPDSISPQVPMRAAPTFDRTAADAMRSQYLANNPRPPAQPMPQRQLPAQAMGQPQGQPFQRPMPTMPQRSMGTPAQMPMANTMNPNAPSARPSMMSSQKQMRGQQMSRQAQAQAGQRRAAQQPVPGAELAGPRSVTPF